MKKRMKSKMSHVFAAFCAVLLAASCLLHFPASAASGRTESYTLSVGSKKTLWLNASERGAMNGVWTSNDPWNVAITSQTSASCTIKVNAKPNVDPVIIHCEYKYPSKNGRYTYYISSYKDFYISVSETSGSSAYSGSYAIKASATSLNVDLAANAPTITITSDAKLSSDLFIRENSASGNKVNLASTGANGYKEVFEVHPERTGSQTVTFELVERKSASSQVIKSKASVRFNVSCSHAYDDGEILKEPDVGQEGSMAYTCAYCGDVKKVSIPALELPETEEEEDDWFEEDDDDAYYDEADDEDKYYDEDDNAYEDFDEDDEEDRRIDTDIDEDYDWSQQYSWAEPNDAQDGSAALGGGEDSYEDMDEEDDWSYGYPGDTDPVNVRDTVIDFDEEVDDF